MKQRIYIGEASLNNLDIILQEYSAKKVFLVRGKKSYELCGAQSRLNSILKKVGVQIFEFHDFEENPKTNPIQMTLSLLFSFYSNLMLAYYAPDKSEQGIANMLGLRTTWQARDYSIAMRKYSGVKTMQIVGEIRYADAKSKGVKNSSMSDGDILRELVFKILH